MAKSYEYERPALAVDCVVFGLDETLKVLLIERGLAPFLGKWALPGGFVRIEETLENAALRELSEETGITKVYLEQLQAFSQLDRDPRERVVSVAFFALVKLSDHRIKAATDAREAAWHDVSTLPKLAFDHDKIVQIALDRLKTGVRHHPIGFELLPPKFTLSALQRLYEAVLEKELDKRNFRKKVLAMGLLEELDEVEAGVSHRAARLYRFNKKRYQEFTKVGFLFEI